MEQAAAYAIRCAFDKGLSIATAESLTGGSVAAAMVSVPGASAVFEGSVVAYSHSVKRAVLGVAPGLLEQRGAVDARVAEAMADGARQALGVDVAVSTTGVAGPQSHDGMPVGAVFVGLSGPAGTTSVQLNLSGTRSEIRAASTEAALRELAAYCRFSDYSQ
ncbi:MAG: CinA family protein [Kocuria sp.]|nr:CinA family protein [Kocuria sp.]